MKIVLDFPDMPNREVVRYPMEFEGSAGYLVVLVNRIDQKLVMSYTVARAPIDENNAVALFQEDEMMKQLEAGAKSMMEAFSK